MQGFNVNKMGSIRGGIEPPCKVTSCPRRKISSTPLDNPNHGKSRRNTVNALTCWRVVKNTIKIGKNNDTRARARSVSISFFNPGTNGNKLVICHPGTFKTKNIHENQSTNKEWLLVHFN